MYLATNVHITFPKPDDRDRAQLKFISCSSFKVESSWQHLTDTCEFVIAKKLFNKEADQLFKKIKVGDPFYIEAGYNGNMEVEFTGFITEIVDDFPVKFKGEDNMYKLKRTPVNTSYKNANLKTVIKDLLPAGYTADAADIQLGDLVYENYTASKVLTELKDNFGIYSYFVGNTLVAGKIYEDNPRNQVVVYDFDNRNFVDNDLAYRPKNFNQIKVTVTSHLPNGKTIKKTVGDPNGQEQKLVCSNVTDETALTNLATKELDRLNCERMTGTITGFGIPVVRHGYTINFKNKANSYKSGYYYVDGVTTTFTDRGAIRRVSKIGRKAAVQVR